MQTAECTIAKNKSCSVVGGIGLMKKVQENDWIERGPYPAPKYHRK